MISRLLNHVSMPACRFRLRTHRLLADEKRYHGARCTLLLAGGLSSSTPLTPLIPYAIMILLFIR